MPQTPLSSQQNSVRLRGRAARRVESFVGLALLVWLAPPEAAAASGKSASLYWANGDIRPFAAGRLAAGLGTGRIGASLGYGMPHWIWAGLDAAATVTPSAAMMQVGLQADALLLGGSVSLRSTRAFAHDLLPVQAHYAAADLDRAAGSVGYRSFDGSLWGTLPLTPLLVNWSVSRLVVLGQRESSALFEEMERVVVRPTGLLAARLMPLYRLGGSLEWYVGALAEHLWLIERSSPHVFRLGPACHATLTEHLSFDAYLTLPVKSPDQLGLLTAAYGTVSLVYRFASSEPRPAMPWR